MNDLAPDKRTKGSPATPHASFVPTAQKKLSMDFMALRFADRDAAGAGQVLPSINHPASTKRRHWAA
jgi:hypothetical protein